jgi:HEAT repeat protein
MTRARLRCVRASLILALITVIGCSKNPPQGEAGDRPREPEVSGPTLPPKIGVQQPPAQNPSDPPLVPEAPDNLAPPPRPVSSPTVLIDGLVARLNHPDSHERVAAAKELGEQGATAHSAIHALVPLLDDPDVEVKTRAAGAILAIGHTKTSGLVDFSATWCGPCRQMQPIVEALKKEGLPVMTVDIDQHPQLATQFQIMFVPTFVTIRDDKETQRSTGATTERALRRILKGIPAPETAPPPLGLKDSAARARVMALLLALTGEDEWIKVLAEQDIVAHREQAGSVLVEVAGGKYPDRVRVGAVKGLLAIHHDGTAPDAVVALLKERVASAAESIDLRGYAGIALHNLKATAPGVVAALRAGLEKGTVPELRERSAAALGELQAVEAVPALTVALDDESSDARKAAAKALGAMGGRSGTAVPRLITLYGKEAESGVGEAVKQALQEIVQTAPDSAPALIAALKSDQPPVRLLAVELLKTADDPQPATAGLRALLDDADASIRIQAAIALQRLGNVDAKVLTVLTASLNEEQENFEASEALRAEARKSALLLAERVVDAKATVPQRLRAVRILTGVDRPSAAARATLVKGLAADAPEVRSCSALALAARTPEDPALLKLLEAGLKSREGELKRECAMALGRTRSGAAVAPLMALLRKDKELREVAAGSLSQLPRDEKTVGELIALLKEPETRSAAARALGQLRENLEPAVRGLIAAFAAAEQEEREQLGDALQSFGQPAVMPLVALFEDATVKEEVRLEALTLVGHMREEAQDAALKLEKYLKDPSVRVRTRVAITLAFQMTDADVTDLLLDAMQNRDESTRFDAQSALQALGPKAARSVDRLVGWLKGPDAARRDLALNTLSSVGRDSPKALSALVVLLKSTEDPNVRRSVAYALTAFQDRGAAELIKVVDDPAYSRIDVVAALRQLRLRAKAAREPLVKCLDDKDRAVAVAAALALATIDPKNEAVVPVLVEGVRSSDREIRSQAVMALGQLGPLAKSAVPEVIRALQTQDTRYAALDALARIGPDAVAAVDVLTRLLNSRDAYAAANALGAIGPAAAPAVPRLLRMLQNENTALAAAAALSKIGGDAKQAIPLLLAKLGDKDQIVQVCQVLGHVGRLDLDQTLPALRKAVSDPEHEVRAAAVSALGQLKSPKALDDLLTALKDQDRSVQRAAVAALGELGAESESAVARLTEVLEAKDPDLRRTAVWALGNIGSKAQSAVPALIKALLDKDVQRDATYTLGRIGAGASAAVPRLMELLDDPQLRYQAAHALSEIGPSAKAALPKLRAFAKDRDTRFAKAAQAAADRIEGKAAPLEEDPE